MRKKRKFFNKKRISWIWQKGVKKFLNFKKSKFELSTTHFQKPRRHTYIVYTCDTFGTTFPKKNPNTCDIKFSKEYKKEKTIFKLSFNSQKCLPQLSGNIHTSMSSNQCESGIGRMPLKKETLPLL